MAIQENEWLMEQQRVDDTVKKIEEKEKFLIAQVQTVKEEAEEIRKNFWEDVTVNFDEQDDIDETYTSIRQQAELLSERERSYGHVDENIKILNRLASSPYFARVDFQEDGEPAEKIYIGIASFLDENDEYLVYDWRAPISSIYYDGTPGPISYDTPDGKREGSMTLKRQFLIKHGKILSLFDTGVTIGDEMLQEVLGTNADTHMKNIVATIQKEQNKIIRDVKSRLLFVQGAAGSGKTSAALQRIAYLLYRFRESLSSEQIILFSPNRLFNHYISKVLPELGENNMVQTTFQEYAQSRIKDLEVESLFSQFEKRVSEPETKNDLKSKTLQLKGDLPFFATIQKYTQDLVNEGVLFKDIRFRGKLLISKEEITSLFYAYGDNYSLANRFPLLTKELLKILAVKEIEETKEPWVEEEMELMDREDYLKAYQHSQKGSKRNQDLFDSFDQEKEFLARKIVSKYFRKIRAGIKRYRFFHHKAQYIDLLKSVPQLLDLSHYDIAESDWREIEKGTIRILQNNEIQMEDTVPYLYLGDLITGRKSNTSMKYVFIDEVQDYSPIQLAYMQFLYPYSKFTMLGDINQSIYVQEKKSPIEMAFDLFGMDKSEVIRLTKSYRSTSAITNFTKAILKDGEIIEEFEREGNKPTIVMNQDSDNMYDFIVEQAEQQLQRYQSVAIIGKSIQECEKAYEVLKDRIDISFINLKNQELKEGIIILPSYLAKGLEFDSVIVLNGSDDLYNKESERKLLYTICTRAMHELFVTSIGNPSRLLDTVPSDLYQIIH